MEPVRVFHPFFHLFSGLLPVHWLIRLLLSASPTGPHLMSLTPATLDAWRRWRQGFLDNPSLQVLGSPALATGLAGCAYLMRDQAVLTALKDVLDGAAGDRWPGVRAAVRTPRAWMLVAGPNAARWRRALKPVLNELPEPVNLYIQAEQLPGLPKYWPLTWSETTRAVLCRGLECSAPISDLAYLTDTLRDG